MAFFHTTPLGRIINRLTKDTVDVDKNLADFAAFFLRSLLQLASTVGLIGIVTPFALPALVPILLLFYFLYQYFQVNIRLFQGAEISCYLLSCYVPHQHNFLTRLMSCSRLVNHLPVWQPSQDLYDLHLLQNAGVSA